jgi:hypothetical protein
MDLIRDLSAKELMEFRLAIVQEHNLSVYISERVEILSNARCTLVSFESGAKNNDTLRFNNLVVDTSVGLSVLNVIHIRIGLAARILDSLFVGAPGYQDPVKHYLVFVALYSQDVVIQVDLLNFPFYHINICSI